jgi:hypothetical protein
MRNSLSIIYSSATNQTSVALSRSPYLPASQLDIIAQHTPNADESLYGDRLTLRQRLLHGTAQPAVEVRHPGKA